jgi:hypothetical protein
MSTTEVFNSSEPNSNEVSTAITNLDRSDPTRYRVEWESEDRHHPTGKYVVHEIGFGVGGKPMLHFVGKRKNGASYTIDSNPGGEPKLIYHPPNDPDQAGRLLSLKILNTESDWTHWVKQRLP